MTPDELEQLLKQRYSRISEVLGVTPSDLHELENLMKATSYSAVQTALLSSVNSKLGEIVTLLSVLADGLKRLDERLTTIETRAGSQPDQHPFLS